MKNDKKLANFLREVSWVFTGVLHMELQDLADIIELGNPSMEEIKLGMDVLLAAERYSRMSDATPLQKEIGQVYRKIQDEFEAGRG